MVKIRLARQGRVHTPSYRIVVSDSRRTPSSAALDQLGSYDSVSGAFTLDEEKALYWLNQGAIASDSVRSLLTKKVSTRSILTPRLLPRRLQKLLLPVRRLMQLLLMPSLVLLYPLLTASALRMLRRT